MFKNTFTDERTQLITLKAGMFAFRLTTALSFLTMFVFALRRKGLVEIDELTMQQILMLPSTIGIFAFLTYKWLKGAVQSELELSGQNTKAKRFAFKNIVLFSILGSVAVSIFSYFYVFKNDLEITLTVGFILLITSIAVSYFTMGKVQDDEQI